MKLKESANSKQQFPNKRKRLIKMLVDTGSSQGDLANKIGMTSVQVNRIVNGHSKGSMDFWEKAADALECEVSDII